MAHRFLFSIPSAFCDQAHLQDTQAFFGPKAKDVVGGEIALAQTIERIELCMAFRSAQQPNVEIFLKKY